MPDDAQAEKGRGLTGGGAARDRRARRLRALVVGGPPLVIGVLALVILLAGRGAIESFRWVAHTRDVLEAARLVLSHTQDAETGQRGYLLTGDSSYLAPYRSATHALARDTSQLRALTRDNPVQQRRLDSLGIVLGERMVELDSTITLAEANRRDEALQKVRTGRGRRLMDDVRTLLARVQADEERLLTLRQADQARAMRRAITIVLVGALIAAALAWTTNRLLVQQAAVLRAANARLEEGAAALRTSERHAEEANRAKSEFLAAMSHELRTPLNAIQGYVQLIEMGVHGAVSEGQRDALERILRAQRHLLGLIDDILNFARLESGRVEYDVRALAPADVVRDVAPMIERQMLAREIAFDVTQATDADAQGVLAFADRDRLAQVLLNLLSNASKFTGAGGRVSVEVATSHAGSDGDGAADGAVLLHVRDTGVGIPAEKLDMIFEPFVQVRSIYSPGAGGTGLGLAISRDLARAMGGDLTVSSAPGAGSTFTVVLRRASE